MPEHHRIHTGNILHQELLQRVIAVFAYTLALLLDVAADIFVLRQRAFQDAPGSKP